MRPEDIDKLFRDQLQQHATPPPANLWYDLQERLEPEERKRRGGFWLYAVAAAVTLLLVAGGAWLLNRPGGLPGRGPASPELATAPRSAREQHQEPNTDAPENNQPLQATPAPASASDALAAQQPTAPGQTPTAEVPRPNTPKRSFTPTPDARRQDAIRMVARAEQPPRPSAPEPKPALRPATPSEALAVQQSAAPAPQALPADPAPSQALAVAPQPRTPQGAIEVEVRESPDLPVLAVAQNDEPAPGRRVRLLGVVKQVGRVVRGEKPDLTEVGLPANPALTVQARVGGHTLSKTISL
ncbi:hypothetical protein [Hymenobacter sp. B81]|uniref:hypothetical protein n=1 Tax=Hymenobacter sp. B81 TaxID=3344878 RepID=UPI0037DCDB77